MTSERPLVAMRDAPAAKLVDDFTPSLINAGEHILCPGCGEPIAMRSLVELVEEMGLTRRAIAVFGVGCYTLFASNLDVEVVQALHGRAPSVGMTPSMSSSRSDRPGSSCATSWPSYARVVYASAMCDRSRCGRSRTTRYEPQPTACRV